MAEFGIGVASPGAGSGADCGLVACEVGDGVLELRAGQVLVRGNAVLNPPLPEGRGFLTLQACVGISSSRCQTGQRLVWTSTISTNRVETSPDQHHAGGVLLDAVGMHAEVQPHV